MPVESINLSEKSLTQLAEIFKNSNQLSESSQIILATVPIIGILFGTFLFYSIFRFYHKQRMLMIEKGIYKPTRLNWNLIFIVSGFVLTFIGLVMTVVFILSSATKFELLGAGIPLAVGLGLIISYLVSNRVSNSDR